jgi:LmbE family N-acetylglucosaminyl deacetylase
MRILASRGSMPPARLPVALLSLATATGIGQSCATWLNPRMQPGRTVAGVFAHPDDETWSMGGLLALLVPAGARGAVWTATRGEAGEIAEGSGATPETLGEVREREERTALGLAGAIEVEFGGLYDGEVARADQDALVRSIAAFLDRARPDVVVTMEPGGVTAHPDHMAVSVACRAAFAAYAAGRRGDGPGPRLYDWGVPSSRLAQFRAWGADAGVSIPGEDEPFGARGTPDELFTCVVDTSAVARTMWDMLLAHATQAGDASRTLLAHRGNWREAFSTVSYIRVHPAPAPDDSVETSVLEAFGA